MIDSDNNKNSHINSPAKKHEPSCIQLAPALLDKVNDELRQMMVEDKASRMPLLDHGLLQNMQRALADLIRKSAEKCLTIGVLGEANSGKSTFINAFAGTRVLWEDVLEDAHPVPVSVEYSDNAAISLIFTDGSGRELPGKKNIGQILQFNSTEKKIQSIHCRAPFPALPYGLRLWDLPAFDTTETGVADKTRELALCCDLLFVTTTLHRPLPMNLLRELKRFASVKPFVFLGTNADLLTNPQLEKMRGFFGLRLKREFGKSFPFYFISANSVGDKRLVEDISPTDDFILFRQKLLQYLNKEKENFILFNCAWRTIGWLEKLLEYLRNLRAYICESSVEIAETVNGFEDRMIRFEREKLEFQNDFRLLLQNMATLCLKEIDRIRSAEELAQFINEDLPVFLKSFIDSFVKSVEKSIKNHLHNLSGKLSGSYEEALEDQASYRNIKNILLKDGELEQMIIQLQAAEKSEKRDSSVRIGGGALTGYLLAALMPGIGWLGAGLAALGGTLLGASFSNDMNKKKSRYREFIRLGFELLSKRLQKEYSLLFKKIMERQKISFNKDMQTKKNVQIEALEFLDDKMRCLEEIRAELKSVCERAQLFTGEENG